MVTCILVIDAEGAGWQHFDVPLTRKIMAMASIGYRDRVERIIVGPVSSIVTAAWKFCRTFMAKNLKDKILITNTPKADLAQIIDAKDIPVGVFDK